MQETLRKRSHRKEHSSQPAFDDRKAEWGRNLDQLPEILSFALHHCRGHAGADREAQFPQQKTAGVADSQKYGQNMPEHITRTLALECIYCPDRHRELQLRDLSRPRRQCVDPSEQDLSSKPESCFFYRLGWPCRDLAGARKRQVSSCQARVPTSLVSTLLQWIGGRIIRVPF